MSSEQHWLVQTIYDTSLDWDKNDLFLENQVFGKRNGKKQSRGLPGIYDISAINYLYIVIPPKKHWELRIEKKDVIFHGSL